MKKVFLASLIAFASSNTLAQVQAGKTMIAKGKVAAELEQGSRKLKRRSPIYDNERVITGNKSKAQLRMTDGGMIALKENSELVIANYQYSGETGEGSVAMELLKGGLRSVTGAIKTESGDYNLKTPVGSIGIRGTHFEVEIIEGDMFLAVWDGAVDLTVDTGTGTENVVSFGEGEDFSFGIVTEEGEVTELLEPPANFDQGHSEDNSEEGSEENSEEGSDGEDSEDSDSEGDGSSDEDSESNDSEDSDSEDSDSEDSDSEDSDSENSDSESSDSENNNESDSNSDEGNNSNDSNSDQNSSGSGEQGNGNSTGGDQSSAGNTGGGSDSSGAGTAGGVDQGLAGGGAGGTDGANTGSGDGASGADQDLSGSDNSFISNDEIDSINNDSIADIVASRTGVFNYSSLTDSTLNSSAGGASGLQMNMTIDFDTGAVPTGALSFTDNGGEWFAAFSGFLIGADINLDVTFASHGDNLADGDINAFFIDEANSISGEFSLFEINNPSVTASGVYRIE